MFDERLKNEVTLSTIETDYANAECRSAGVCDSFNFFRNRARFGQSYDWSPVDPLCRPAEEHPSKQRIFLGSLESHDRNPAPGDLSARHQALQILKTAC